MTIPVATISASCRPFTWCVFMSITLV
ncbi:hypothetical protein [Fibrisoma montanum]